MKVSSSPRVPNEPFNQKKDLTVTNKHPTTNEDVVQTIQDHLIKYVAHHILSVEGVFNAQGYLDIEQTFAPMLQRLPEGVQGDYNLSVLTSVFSGVRVLRDCCQNWLGSRQLKNFGDHVRLLSNQFYELNPEILRTGTIQDEGIVSDLDRPSKMLYVGSDKIFAGIQQSQQQFVNNDREKAMKLQQKIWSMKKRMLQYDSVFCRQFQFIVPQVQESLGAAFAEPLQYFNVNFMHSPVALHFDRAGFAGSNDFTGDSSSIATLRLRTGSRRFCCFARGAIGLQGKVSRHCVFHPEKLRSVGAFWKL